MLHEFITVNRADIILRCKTKALTRSPRPSTDVEGDHGVPQFLNQLVAELRLGLSRNPEIGQTATQHGRDLRRRGFTASQVVHDYGDVCQSITELAVEANEAISTDDFRMLNRCLDDAIASAVTEFGREGVEPIDGAAAGETDRLGVLAREARAAIDSASVALEAIKSGHVGIAGSTGTVLARNLLGAHDLLDRVLVEAAAARRGTATKT